MKRSIWSFGQLRVLAFRRVHAGRVERRFLWGLLRRSGLGRVQDGYSLIEILGNHAYVWQSRMTPEVLGGLVVCVCGVGVWGCGVRVVYSPGT